MLYGFQLQCRRLLNIVLHVYIKSSKRDVIVECYEYKGDGLSRNKLSLPTYLHVLLLLLAAILSSCLAIFKLLTTSSKLSSVRCQRKTWSMGTCALVDYNLTLSRLQNRLQHIYQGNPIPELTL